MNQEELNEILKQHELWLKENCKSDFKFILDGRYAIEESGIVYSLVRKGKMLNKPSKIKSSIKNNGYVRVFLRGWDGVTKQYLLHRLICHAFKGMPINSKKVVHHIDSDKKNNNLDNLMICTQKFNGKFSLMKRKVNFKKNNKILKRLMTHDEAIAALKRFASGEESIYNVEGQG